MANKDNNLSHVKVDYIPSIDFDEIMKKQHELQELIQPGFYNPNESIASIADFFMKNKHAFDDEFGEALDALGGINDGIGSASWKWWKQLHHTEAQKMTLNDLSPEDRHELNMEMADQFFFLLNFMVKIGMTGSELHSYYLAKHKENINRQLNGY